MRNLCLRRKRVIENFTKTVTEVWIGGYLSGIIVNELTRCLETEEQHTPDSSNGNNWIGKVTATVEAVQSEYLWPAVENQTETGEALQSNYGSCNLVKAESDYPITCVPLCQSSW